MPLKAKPGAKGSRKVLGRGLSALLPPVPASVASGSAPSGDLVIQCELDSLHPRPDQPRQHFDEDRLAELADSIRQLGVLQPLLVRAAGSGYEIVLGERRYRAARRAGLERVPVQVVDADDERAFQMALVENIQREDLGPLEEAEAYRRLVDDFGLTQEVVAERVGKDRSTVANALRILKLPRDVKAALAEGQLTAGHARALLSLPRDRIATACRQIISRGLSVRATEAFVRRLREGAPTPKGGPEKSPELRELEDRLCHSLGTRVLVKSKRGGTGRIEISYHSLEELDRLLDVLLP